MLSLVGMNAIFIFCVIISAFSIEIPLNLSKFEPHSDYIVHSSMLHSVDYKLLTGSFYIGTPKQEFNLVIDTTSSFSWIPNSNLQKTYPHTFNSKLSMTFISNGTSLNAPIGDMFQRGGISLDVIDYTKEKRGKDLAPSFQFILIDTSNETKKTVEGFDGSLSLHKPMIDKKHYPYSFPEYLLSENIINHNKFAIEILNNNKSTLYIDEDYIINEIINNKNNTTFSCKSSISDNNNWNCPLTGIRIGNEYFMPNQLIHSATIDSTKPYIIAPHKEGMKILDTYVKKLGDCSVYEKDEKYNFIACYKIFDLKKVDDLCFKIEKEELCIKGSDLFYKGKDLISGQEILVFKVVAINLNVREWKFGLPMFYNKMIVFDGDNNELTFIDVNDVKDFAHSPNHLLKNNSQKIKMCLLLIVLSLISALVLLFIKCNVNKMNVGLKVKANRYESFII